MVLIVVVGCRMLLINEKEVSLDFDVSFSFSVYETDYDACKGEVACALLSSRLFIL